MRRRGVSNRARCKAHDERGGRCILRKHRPKDKKTGEGRDHRYLAW